MYIHEAVVSALESNSFIRRSAWKKVLTPNPTYAAIKIQPTNTPGGCFLHYEAVEKICPGWQPKAEDLLADDWEVIVF